MFDSNGSSDEEETIQEIQRRNFRSLSAMVWLPKNFVPILRPKKNELGVSPLRLRDSTLLDGYFSDGEKNERKNFNKNIILLNNISTSTSSSSNKSLPFIMDKFNKQKKEGSYQILKNKKKSLSILTLLQKRK